MYNQKPLLGTLPNYAHPLSKGLVGTWIFNENSGNRIFDLSGNGNHGTFGAGAAAPIWVAGKMGSALDFDGIADYVNCGDDVSLISDYITVEALIKSDINGVDYSVHSHIINRKQTYFGAYGLAINPFSGKLYFSIRLDGSETTTRAVNANSAMLANIWYHLIGTYDGSTIKLYVNGLLQDETTSISGVLDQDNNNHLLIGAKQVSSNWFNGIIDKVMIYNRALSASKIWQLHVNPYCMFAQPMEPELMYAAPPIGVIMNQFQKTNLGADLYDGVLIT